MAIHIFDTNCIAYQAFLVAQKFNSSFDETVEAALAMAVYYNQLAFLPPEDKAPHHVIWVDDSPPYWRFERFPGYKAGRAPKPDNFTEVKKKLTAYLNPWSVAGYEADDLAATVCRTYRGRLKRVITVDFDWQGLIDSKTAWVNISHREPFLLHVGGYLSHPTAQIDYGPFGFARHKSEHPRDIWTYKQRHGDSSDKIKANQVGLDIISLYECPKEHRLWLKKGIKDLIAPHLRENFKADRDANRKLLRTGASRLGYGNPLTFTFKGLTKVKRSSAA